MACRGVHFALTEEEANAVFEANDDEELMRVVAEIEERWDNEWLEETDKAWDAVHRCLTDGSLRYGDTPMHKCILGDVNIHDGDDYIVNALEPAEVKEVAEAIKDITEVWMRDRYYAIDPDDYGMPPSEEDFGYTWSYFESLKAFFQKAALANRHVVFTVDQ